MFWCMVGAVLVQKPGQEDVTQSQILFITGTWKLLWFALASITIFSSCEKMGRRVWRGVKTLLPIYICRAFAWADN